MWIAIAVIAVIVLYFVSVYNGLVARRNQVREAWATVDTQLKRRFDLIPNLTNAVKGATKHERETLAAVVNARNTSVAADTVADKVAADNALTGALRQFFALAENYPTLQANQNFLELQSELGDTETKIQAARQFYNTEVMALNTAIEQFPTSIVANLFAIRNEEFFKIDEAEKAAPKVEF
jgi:LemA protein